jgi:hypothetical protein
MNRMIDPLYFGSEFSELKNEQNGIADDAEDVEFE